MILKKKNKFLKIQKQIERLIETKRFEEAVKLYLSLLKSFKRLEPDEKLDNEDELNKTKLQLLTYQKTKDLIYSTKADNLNIIKDQLNQLKSYLENPELKESLRKYAQNKLNHFLKVHEYKVHKIEIERLLKEAYHRIYEGNYDGALGMFPEIFDQYKQMEQYFKNEELYKYITELRDHLKITLLENKPMGKVAQHTKPKE
jgi:hypothetical protein